MCSQANLVSKLLSLSLGSSCKWLEVVTDLSDTFEHLLLKSLQGRGGVGLQTLAHGSQNGLVQLVDSIVERVDGLVSLLLPRALGSDGQQQGLDRVTDGFGVLRQKLPHVDIVRINSQVLCRREKTA